MIPKYYPNPTALDSFDKALGCNYYKMKESRERLRGISIPESDKKKSKTQEKVVAGLEAVGVGFKLEVRKGIIVVTDTFPKEEVVKMIRRYNPYNPQNITCDEPFKFFKNPFLIFNFSFPTSYMAAMDLVWKTTLLYQNKLSLVDEINNIIIQKIKYIYLKESKQLQDKIWCQITKEQPNLLKPKMRTRITKHFEFRHVEVVVKKKVKS